MGEKLDKVLEGYKPIPMKRMFYPRGMKLSEDFVNAFHREFDRLVGEGVNPKSLVERFGKAMRFHQNEERRYHQLDEESANKRAAKAKADEKKRQHKKNRHEKSEEEHEHELNATGDNPHGDNLNEEGKKKSKKKNPRSNSKVYDPVSGKYFTPRKMPSESKHMSKKEEQELQDQLANEKQPTHEGDRGEAKRTGKAFGGSKRTGKKKTTKFGKQLQKWADDDS